MKCNKLAARIFFFRFLSLSTKGKLIQLTYSMVQSPSWEANWFAGSQEIPRISRNPKVHYHTHKRPPPVSILSQPNPVHIPTSHLLEIHPNIIHPSKIDSARHGKFGTDVILYIYVCVFIDFKSRVTQMAAIWIFASLSDQFNIYRVFHDFRA